MPPLVSVLINNFNYGEFLSDAIESVFRQSYPYIELVVVDDGSTDNSRDIISQYRGRLHSIFQANGGQAAAFNAGFAASGGEIVCFLDADDRFAENKVVSIVDAFEAHPAAGWCFHPLALMGTSTPVAVPNYPLGKAADFRSAIQRGRLRVGAPATSGLAFRRSLLRRILPMPEDIRITSDNYLKFSALALSPGYFHADLLAEQRLHGRNAYTSRAGSERLRGEVAMKTAVALMDRVPSTGAFAVRLYAVGLARALRHGGNIKTYSKTTRKFCRGLSAVRTVDLITRVSGHMVRNFLAP